MTPDFHADQSLANREWLHIHHRFLVLFRPSPGPEPSGIPLGPAFPYWLAESTKFGCPHWIASGLEVLLKVLGSMFQSVFHWQDTAAELCEQKSRTHELPCMLVERHSWTRGALEPSPHYPDAHPEGPHAVASCRVQWRYQVSFSALVNGIRCLLG